VKKRMGRRKGKEKKGKEKKGKAQDFTENKQ